MEEKLIVREKDSKLRVAVNTHRGWNDYKRTLMNKDYKQLAIIFYELVKMGYPVDKAFARYKELANNPDLFFL